MGAKYTLENFALEKMLGGIDEREGGVYWYMYR